MVFHNKNEIVKGRNKAVDLRLEMQGITGIAK
jgi:hypothetical protein